jgi:hypothetical protein
VSQHRTGCSTIVNDSRRLSADAGTGRAPSTSTSACFDTVPATDGGDEAPVDAAVESGAADAAGDGEAEAETGGE